MSILNLLLQVSIDGLTKAGETSVVAGLLVAIIIVLSGVCVYIHNKWLAEIKSGNDVREDALKREAQRNKEMLESEKETLTVLNGVTAVLEMAEKINEHDTDNIIKTITNESDKIQKRIEDLEDNIKKGKK